MTTPAVLPLPSEQQLDELTQRLRKCHPNVCDSELAADAIAALRSRVAGLEAENERLREALEAACIINKGRACFRTMNGIPMGMPVKAERIVRRALAAPRKE